MKIPEFKQDIIAGNVKAAMKDAGASSGDLWRVPRDQIKVLPNFNVRVRNDEHRAQVRMLADSMLANGYHQDKPIAGYVVVENGQNVIITTDGHTRLEAVDLANSEGAEISVLPVVTKPKGTSLEDITVALVTSNSGRHLQPIEVGEVCKRLIGYGLDEETIAKRLNLTAPYVGELLTLAGAPARIRKLVAEGKIASTLAMSTMKKNPEQAADLLEEAVQTAKAAGKDRATAKHLPKRETKPREPKLTALEELTQLHAELLESNPYCYFELAYTRKTEWMAFICDKPAEGVIGTPEYGANRKVIAQGQGWTQEEACKGALNYYKGVTHD
ncbi:ParB/RepB/Spo0J family partition protein [Cupriavidus necator]